MLAKMFAGDKTTWEKWAVSLGAMEPESVYYTRQDKERDLAKVSKLEELFAKFDWSQDGQQPE